MAASRKVIHKRIGIGGTHGSGPDNDVRVIQTLLKATNQVVGSLDGRWGKHTEDALRTFQTMNGLQSTGFIEPNDDTLIKLLDKAGILITLPGTKDIAAMIRLHDWFKSKHVAYEWEAAHKGGGTRAYYGLDGNSKYVVQTNHTLFEEGPLKMNCTTYVNLMLSVYATGTAHQHPYDADCSKYGGKQNKHLANDRYGLPLVTRMNNGKEVRYFSDAEQIQDAVNTSSVYVLEIDHDRAKGVAHMALLTNNNVYESTNLNGYDCDTCMSTSLDAYIERQQRRNKGTIYYLFGPA